MSFYQVNPNQSTIDISIVIPVMNEALNINELALEINRAMEPVNSSWECLWIDDGSTDETLKLLSKLAETDSNHRYVSFARNFGQSAAFAAGFSEAFGKILVMMDGDGQNDPADIPKLVETLIEKNCDLVQGYRFNREDSIVRKISSRLGNGFRNWQTKESIRDVGCSIRAFKKTCVANIIAYKGMHRFLPTLIRINGYNNIVEIPVNHRPRLRGQTKYGISNRLMVGLKDTFAVKWMMTRLVKPELKIISSDINKNEASDE